ncbi:hypothetical protein SCHPADRAFT_999335 [Schizopora paradoxa]|uniref:MYND-type domain-containing protein n=1 Tax=Schizopora paradoxa TaxID=27342 RepID=A0A0H2S196_9AGAM|nr:hypothetical protein SCHPADRAFT_999335 [Schizopora paradoxa]
MLEEEKEAGIDLMHEGFLEYLDDINIVEMLRTDPARVSSELDLLLRECLVYALNDKEIFSTYPDDVLPGIFCFCCGMLREFASLSEKAISEDEETWIGYMHPSTQVLNILTSIRIHGYLRQLGSHDDPSVTPILAHWPELYLAMKTLHKSSKSRDSQLESFHPRLIAGQIGDILVAFLSNDNIRPYFTDDTDLRKFAWRLWLENGISTTEDKEILCGSIARAVMLLSTKEGDPKSRTSCAMMFTVCMSVCDEFGGKNAVAEIALMSAYRTMMSNDEMLVRQLLPQQIGVLASLADCDVIPENRIARRIYEMDGIPKLIEATLNILSRAQDADFRSVLDFIGEATVTLIETLATENYIQLEVAIRSGLFRIFVAVQTSVNGPLEFTRKTCFRLIETISLFFPYYSVIQALAEQFRELTEEDEARMLGEGGDGTIEFAWKGLKRSVISSYILTRMFESCAQPFPKICNNCTKLEAGHNFFQCPGCARIPYCSAECQATDLKAGRHSELCQKIIDGKSQADKNIPFLYFAVNKCVQFTCKDLGQSTLPAKDPILIWNATRTREQVSVSIRPKDIADSELHDRRLRNYESYRVIDGQQIKAAKMNGIITTYIHIQAMYREGRENCVVRYLRFDLDYGRVETAFGPPMHELHVLRAIKKDISIKYPEADLEKSWILRNRDGERIHLFDEVDAYFRDKFGKYS